MKRILHEIEQGTEEWFQARLGKATSSNFACIMAHADKGKWGEPAKKYAMRIALEDKTKCVIETYSNDFMERGVMLEPEARALYEEKTLSFVEKGGFMEFGNVGSSADGLVGEGMIEIKSVIYSTHFKNIEQGYDSGYKWQMQGQMWVYDRPWCDFVSYCPEFPEDKQLHICRVERDEEEISKLNDRIHEFFILVDKHRRML